MCLPLFPLISCVVSFQLVAADTSPFMLADASVACHLSIGLHCARRTYMIDWLASGPHKTDGSWLAKADKRITALEC